MERQFAILVAVPHDAAFAKLNGLLANDAFALGCVRLVEGERNFLAAHDAYRHVGLLAVHGQLLRALALTQGFNLGSNRFDSGFAHATFGDDGLCLLSCQAFKVGRTGCDEHA